jgi:hypothetical protein
MDTLPGLAVIGVWSRPEVEILKNHLTTNPAKAGAEDLTGTSLLLGMPVFPYLQLRHHQVIDATATVTTP